MSKGSLGLVLLLLTLAPLAFAQKPKKKPAATPAASASAAPADATPPPTSPDPAAAAPASPDANAAAATDADGGVPQTHAEVKAEEELGTGTSTDVAEKPGKTYYFVGLRYRGTVIPKFMVNLFVDEGATFYSNSLGVELDMRKDGFSLIPALSYVEYGTGGEVLFLQKGKDRNLAGNWSYVDSSLKAIYATADLLWSVKVHKNFDFEYGAGFGLGIIFGDLVTNWVQFAPNGPLVASDGTTHFAPCVTVGPPGTGCNAADHQNSSVNKVGNYAEPSWVNGGSKPNIFPHIAFPMLGLRYKPIKQFEARLQIGFSLTGFFFGLNGAYGLEKPEKQ